MLDFLKEVKIEEADSHLILEEEVLEIEAEEIDLAEVMGDAEEVLEAEEDHLAEEEIREAVQEDSLEADQKEGETQGAFQGKEDIEN